VSDRLKTGVDRMVEERENQRSAKALARFRKNAREAEKAGRGDDAEYWEARALELETSP
jgi:hypothetical protein